MSRDHTGESLERISRHLYSVEMDKGEDLQFSPGLEFVNGQEDPEETISRERQSKAGFVERLRFDLSAEAVEMLIGGRLRTLVDGAASFLNPATRSRDLSA